MSNTYYNGKPIEDVDFRSEFETELFKLLAKVDEIKSNQIKSGDKFNYQYWTIKLSDANKRLEKGEVVLS